MKRRLWIAVGILVVSCGAVFAVGALEQAAKSRVELTALLPEGALLSIEARDFRSLLRDWSGSSEKRAWLTSDNYASFSNSRLFTRLSQAQDEFSAAAGIPTDEDLLNRVAGKESCLALYDIGNLEFVYITRLNQQAIEGTPLWQTRGKFDQRTEAGSVFYVHKDTESSRTAAFAAKDGWLILGTKENLVAGVLDRMAGTAQHNLANEAWFAETVKQATGERGDLRMVLNLEKIVVTPHFRSYWIERNITEMKQYASAVSDLYRTRESYREERVLLRRASAGTPPQGDIQTLAQLAPVDAGFYSAQSAPDAESVLKSLREKLLEVGAAQSGTQSTTAPAAAASGNAGSASDLDMPIDHAPYTESRVDNFAPLRALLRAQQPDGELDVFSSRAPKDGVFVSLQTAVALNAPHEWDADAVRRALTTALPTGVTAGKLGVNWEKRPSAAGEYLALDGSIPLYAAINGKQLILANDSALMEHLLARRGKVNSTESKDAVTYTAMFRPAQERGNYHLLMAQLDQAIHHSGASQQAADGDADTMEAGASAGPNTSFFSGNVESLSKVFAKVESERIEEKDQGAKVLQTVTYQWSH